MLFLTDLAGEKAVNHALAEIEKLEYVKDKVVLIRIEDI